jgi:glucose-6-phosphate isomerase
MIRGGVEKKNITVWEPGRVGDEYIKSYGHYHVTDFDERYEILAGEGIVLLQTREIDASGKPVDDSIASFQARRVKAGDTVDIPRRAGHLMINTGMTWLVTRDDSPVNTKEMDPISHPAHADYTPFKKMHGAAYYVVDKKGLPTLEKNKTYKNIPPATIE